MSIHRAIDPTRFFPTESALQPEGLLHTRGIAGSGFRPLSNIPHCCLPQESGPCLSPSVADHPLRPATDHRLGEPLPHQQANRTQGSSVSASLQVEARFPRRAYAVLARVSPSCSPLSGRFLRVTHPVRHSSPGSKLPRVTVRLACVKHAASVQSEPRSNSPFQFASRRKQNLRWSIDADKTPTQSVWFLVFKEQKSLTHVQGMNKYTLFANLQGNIYFFLMLIAILRINCFFNIVFVYSILKQ